MLQLRQNRRNREAPGQGRRLAGRHLEPLMGQRLVDLAEPAGGAMSGAMPETAAGAAARSTAPATVSATATGGRGTTASSHRHQEAQRGVKRPQAISRGNTRLEEASSGSTRFREAQEATPGFKRPRVATRGFETLQQASRGRYRYHERGSSDLTTPVEDPATSLTRATEIITVKEVCAWQRGTHLRSAPTKPTPKVMMP